MTDSAEEDSPESKEFKPQKATIQRAELLEDYLKRYGKKSLKWKGYPKNSLIIEMKYSSSQDSKIIYFDYSKTICGVLKQFRAEKPINLEGKTAEFLIMDNTVVGFKAPRRKSYFFPSQLKEGYSH